MLTLKSIKSFHDLKSNETELTRRKKQGIHRATKPCKRCNGVTRYNGNYACVSCVKEACIEVVPTDPDEKCKLVLGMIDKGYSYHVIAKCLKVSLFKISDIKKSRSV